MALNATSGAVVGTLTAPSSSLPLIQPSGLAFDSTSGTLYVADRGAHRVVAITSGSGSSLWVANPVPTLVVGSGGAGFVDGAALDAQLDGPTGLAFDSVSGNLFVGDSGNHAVRVIRAPSTGGNCTVATLAGNSTAGFGVGGAFGDGAVLEAPQGVAVAPGGATVYVADAGNNRIAVLANTSNAAATGYTVATLAGGASAWWLAAQDGYGTDASLSLPLAVSLSSDGKALLIADFGNNALRVVDIATGYVSTPAGAQLPSAAGRPLGVAPGASAGSAFVTASREPVFIVSGIP
jgi:DNA-binding beta-propeller fold protein YncE